MPRANSFTRMPESLAIRKCPSSWKNTTKPKSSTPIIISRTV